MSKEDLRKKITSEPISWLNKSEFTIIGSSAPIGSAPIGTFGVIKDILKMWWKYSGAK
ncbi:MAG: hypothetical protein IJ859_11105 [Synergistaceae bacterium]|nr:hypothetical protein [Synergistaceae bacterium]